MSLLLKSNALGVLLSQFQALTLGQLHTSTITVTSDSVLTDYVSNASLESNRGFMTA